MGIMKFGVFGVIGQVGWVMCILLVECYFFVDEVWFFVFVCLVGQKLLWNNGLGDSEVVVEDIVMVDFVGFDIVIFFVGGGIFCEFVFCVVVVGVVVIDNFFVW